MTRQWAAPAAIGAALVLSALLAVLAADALRWGRALESGDARFATSPGRPGMWTPETRLPGGLSRALLGVDDDLELRGAMQQFRLAKPREPVTEFGQLAGRSAAERALARVVREEPTRIRRSIAANLRGALALEEARLAAGQLGLLRRAAAHFRQAVVLDPANVDAKYNLELVLRLLRGGRGEGGGGGRADTPASGAGSATAGSGF